MFSGVSFSVAAGTLLRVTGANGAGKTTLLRILAGLAAPQQVKSIGGRATPGWYRQPANYVSHANAPSTTR